ncbi:glycoside hydrolase family 43 protein [Microtetraspora fusca]|uniref:glycoside hydrolase family 43 protein n=1 Tax=Microtetraspora fusca TaxID=1997 RepID=UPI000A068000|nr:glycoside hydrolase family 43 protein [Microtetraspora fusca]
MTSGTSRVTEDAPGLAAFPAEAGYFRNPVLPGCHPDPSICRVGEDYYLVTSTFAWFPGVPIFHSRDLVHWRQIGHILDRPSQLDLDGVALSDGVYAPTIRHHDGVFYMITTLVGGGGNFVVTANDPAGPWSDPHWLPETRGIDPSLFFDEDGTAWVLGTREKDAARYPGETEVWLRRLDGLTPTGEEHVIWEAVHRRAVWSEGPHIYRIGDWYYLLTAEGGTARDHAVMIARSRHVTGPYEPDPRNPVLTHRAKGRDHPIAATGHADLVDTPAGEWWMVLLATRPYGGDFANLGRETFLTPVTWEDGWPVVGEVTPIRRSPALAPHRWPAAPVCDHFDGVRLSPVWNHLRTPREPYWSLSGGRLWLRARPETVARRESPSLVARRQQHRDFAAYTALDFVPDGDECAGLALVQNEDFHILVVLTARGLELRVREAGAERLLARADVPPGRVHLGVEAHGQDYRARYALAPDEWRDLGGPVDGRILSSTVAGGFTGAYIGMYASSNGRPGENSAAFDWFEYRGL